MCERGLLLWTDKDLRIRQIARGLLPVKIHRRASKHRACPALDPVRVRHARVTGIHTQPPTPQEHLPSYTQTNAPTSVSLDPSHAPCPAVYAWSRTPRHSPDLCATPRPAHDIDTSVISIARLQDSHFLDMRLLAYTVAIAGATLLGQAIPTPVQTRGQVAQHVEERRIEQREDITEEQKEALKYFHEPGYACYHLTGLRS